MHTQALHASDFPECGGCPHGIVFLANSFPVTCALCRPRGAIRAQVLPSAARYSIHPIGTASWVRMQVSRSIGSCGLRAPKAPVVSHQPCLAPYLPHAPVLRVNRCLAAASDDPFEVLGIKPDADQLEITRAYNRGKSKYRGNVQMTQKIEAAHGQLMMQAFNARLKGGKTIPKEIKYADREQLFPWRPKRWDATPQVIMIFGALQLGLMAFAFQAPNINKAMGCMLVGIAGNVMKQNAIFPPPEDPEMATEEEEGRAGRNFIRGALLGLMATFSGILLFSAPEYLQQLLQVTLPVAPGTIVALKVAGSAIFNWVMTAYYY